MRILLLAWEFPGINTIQGTALARRIGQIAFGLSKNHQITVVHPNHQNEPEELISMGESIQRLPVNYKMIETFNISILRKLQTIIISAVLGDRTSAWAKSFGDKVFQKIGDYDIVISFFTPRAPIYLGYLLQKKNNKPWIVDFQDPFLEGITSGFASMVTTFWTRMHIKKCKSIIYVNEEWAKRDSFQLKRKIEVFPHAIPNFTNFDSIIDIQALTLIYAGSLDTNTQFPFILIDILNQTENKVVLKVAGHKKVAEVFENNITNSNIEITWLGWLNEFDLKQNVSTCSAIVLIPWYDKSRLGIPSKLFEYLSWNRPIFIIGKDNGSLEKLLKHYQKEDTLCDSLEKAKYCLNKMITNDFSQCLQGSEIAEFLYQEDQLISDYQNLINKIIE